MACAPVAPVAVAVVCAGIDGRRMDLRCSRCWCMEKHASHTRTGAGAACPFLCPLAAYEASAGGSTMRFELHEEQQTLPQLLHKRKIEGAKAKISEGNRA